MVDGSIIAHIITVQRARNGASFGRTESRARSVNMRE
jgi:hypothetical protein